MKIDYEVIASSSLGNCVRIENVIYDMGISFKKASEKIDFKRIDIILYSHVHGDHFKLSTLKKALEVNRRIHVYCNKDISKILENNGIKHTLLDIGVEVTERFKNGNIVKFSAVNLYHDIPNQAYRLTFKDFFDEVKVFLATDTSTLDGITAKDYNYYFLETNYSEDKIDSFDKDRVIGTHLSREQAENFFITMKNESSVMIQLHKSSRNY